MARQSLQLCTTNPHIFKGNLERVSISIHNMKQQPVERFVFEIAPIKKAISTDQHILKPLAELEIGLRAFLLKIHVSDSILKPLPKGSFCTFYIKRM